MSMSLEERVATLEAKLAIMTLEAEYARTWDTGDGAGWAGVFTVDGVFELVGAGDRPTRSYEGEAALKQFCETFNALWTGLHLMHAPEITVEGDRARGRVHFEWTAVSCHDPDHTAQVRVHGYYEITYRNTPAGWRMLRRVEHGVGRSESQFGVL
jgi:hypothetical protein